MENWLPTMIVTIIPTVRWHTTHSVHAFTFLYFNIFFIFLFYLLSIYLFNNN